MKQLGKSIHAPFFPSRELLAQYIDDIYANGWLTNHGPLVSKLEERLADYLNMPYVIAVANGTLALQLAIRLLDLKGEAITSPLSFVATANALQWEGITPRFADVRDDTFCLDAGQLERLISPRTSAIIPVHIFGQACDVDSIDEVAQRHGLPVIYDAAQAFGLKTDGKNVLKHGAISVLSFHATKVFHTIEGGALIVHDQVTYERALRFRSHGRVDLNMPPALGVNAKLSELHAACGHCMLDEMPKIQRHYGELRTIYQQRFRDMPQIRLPQFWPADHVHCIYMPVVFDDAHQRQTIEQRLQDRHIPPRRYFDPPLNHLPQFHSHDPCPKAEGLAERMMLLPMPAENGAEIVQQVCDIIEAVVRPGQSLGSPHHSMTR